MKLFKDLEDGEVFCLSCGKQLIKLNNSYWGNAVSVLGYKDAFSIPADEETYTPDEMFENSEEAW